MCPDEAEWWRLRRRQVAALHVERRADNGEEVGPPGITSLFAELDVSFILSSVHSFICTFNILLLSLLLLLLTSLDLRSAVEETGQLVSPGHCCPLYLLG